MRTPKSTPATPRTLPTDMQPPLEALPAPVDSALSNDESMRQRIAEAAYYHAEQRGFAPGHELDDWLAAEAEIVGHTLERVSTYASKGTQ